MSKQDGLVECDCSGWKKSWHDIECAQSLAYTHSIPYTGQVFRYCPWCGKKFEEIK